MTEVRYGRTCGAAYQQVEIEQISLGEIVAIEDKFDLSNFHGATSLANTPFPFQFDQYNTIDE
jgi:hypothetical protein